MRRGFSLVELLIVLAIVGIFIAVIAGNVGGCNSTADVTATATRNAKAYAASMGIEIKGASCSGSDSDGDGYVSCSLNTADGKLEAIECGYDKAITPMAGQNTGCKVAMPKLGTTVQ